ncbi:MAG: DUF2953 domain-containing protein [Clostridia bacterium]|nr:DUF2953 domain-containing protein [Clostridia bacterium]
MWAVYILLALLALIIIVLLIPIYGRMTYDGKLVIKIWFLGIEDTVWPEAVTVQPDGTTAPKKRRRLVYKLSRIEELAELVKQEDLMTTLYFLKEAIKLEGKALWRFLDAVTVDRFDLQMLLATGDPAETAQFYGEVCSFLYPILEWVSRKVRFRKKNVRVEPNFLLEQSDVRMDVRFRMSLPKLIGIVLKLAVGLALMQEEDDNLKEDS